MTGLGADVGDLLAGGSGGWWDSLSLSLFPFPPSQAVNGRYCNSRGRSGGGVNGELGVGKGAAMTEGRVEDSAWLACGSLVW